MKWIKLMIILEGMEKTFLHYTDYKESPSVSYDWYETFTSPLLSVGWGVVEIWKNLRENHDPLPDHGCPLLLPASKNKSFE